MASSPSESLLTPCFRAFEDRRSGAPTPRERMAKAALKARVLAGLAPVVAERYALCEQLGAGGWGVVFRAPDLELDRHVAVKLLGADRVTPAPEPAEREQMSLGAPTAAGPAARSSPTVDDARLLREARNLAKLQRIRTRSDARSSRSHRVVCRVSHTRWSNCRNVELLSLQRQGGPHSCAIANLYICR